MILRAALRKEITLLARDRGALASLFLLPIVFISVFGAIFGDGSEPRSRISVFVEQPTALTQKLLVALAATPAIHLENATSADQVRQRVASEEADCGLVLDRSFEPEAGRPGELILGETMPEPRRARLQGELTGIALTALLGRSSPPVLFRITSPPGARRPLRRASGFQLAVPGNVVLFGFFLALTVALSFIEERNTGTFHRVLAAPVARTTLVVAKLVTYVLVGLGQMAFLFGMSIALFGLQVGDGYLELTAITAALVVCATCLGLLIASMSGTEKQVGAIGSICLLVMGLVGGAMVPRLILPATMQKIGLMTPHGWALDGYYDILVREGVEFSTIAPEFFALLSFALIFALIGTLRFRFE